MKDDPLYLFNSDCHGVLTIPTSEELKASTGLSLLSMLPLQLPPHPYLGQIHELPKWFVWVWPKLASEWEKFALGCRIVSPVAIFWLKSGSHRKVATILILLWSVKHGTRVTMLGQAFDFNSKITIFQLHPSLERQLSLHFSDKLKICWIYRHLLLCATVDIIARLTYSHWTGGIVQGRDILESHT